LGRNFINQLKDSEFLKFWTGKRLGPSWQHELTQAQQATEKYFDLRFCKTLSDVVYHLYGQMEQGPEVVKIAEWILREASKCKTPLFVHFDEVGALGDNVKYLRGAVQKTWHLMLQHEGEMPRVYFYLSGKSVPLTAIGGPDSGVGTKWIILDLLQVLKPLSPRLLFVERTEKHIEYIIETSTRGTSPLLSPRLARLPQLPQVLQLWTGGSPRLLVYTLRALHHLLQCQKGEDAEHLDAEKTEKIMEKVYQILAREVPQVASEVFLASRDEAEWRQTWLYLILLAQLRVPCNREMKLPVGSHEHSLDLLLGDTAGISAEDVLEQLVEQRIIVQACMCPGQRWGDMMKPLLHGTHAETLAVVLDQGCPLATFPKITSVTTERENICLPLPTNLHPNNLAAAMQLLSSNRLYRPAPKSNSADLFIKQSNLIIELQDKSGVSAGVSFIDACQEVDKCIQEGPVLWVLVALKLTDSLLRCVGTEKALLLTPGVYQEENSAEGGLLYRPAGKSKKWQKRILHGTWSDLGSARVEAKDTCRLEVREGLELVIPHPEHVQAFLGDDFEI
ncbi:unnamed protein product, partial [Symbiodinium necroappetens]